MDEHERSGLTMLDALPNSNLITYRKAVEAAGTAIELVRRVPSPLKSLADQIIRSAASVPANLSFPISVFGFLVSHSR